MRCKCIENFGGLIIFFDNKFNDINLSYYLKDISDVSYTTLVFLDTNIAINMYQIIDSYYFPGQINITLCNCANNDVLKTTYQLKEKNLINLITVSIADVYKSLNYPNTIIGVEYWDTYGITNSVLPIGNITMIKDIFSLREIIDNIVDEILKYSPRNDLEKILLLDYWIQKNIQYIDSKESHLDDTIYICDDIKEYSTIKDVLINHYGTCEGIAFTAALILNHPKINVNCRQVGSATLCHSWNIVKCNEKEYYCDFTRNITRNPNKIAGALKSSMYSNEFTLLGREDTKSYIISNEYNCYNISSKSYPRNDINNYFYKIFNTSIPSFKKDLVKNSYIKGGCHGNQQ